MDYREMYLDVKAMLARAIRALVAGEANEADLLAFIREICWAETEFLLGAIIEL